MLVLGTYFRSAALGLATAGRSFTPIALISRASTNSGVGVERRSVPFLSNPIVSRVLQFCAIGEIVVDKFPFVPARTMPGSLAARTALGGVSALVVAHDSADSANAACIGGVSAGLGSFALMHARLGIVQKGCPDWLVALIEDALVILTCRIAIRTSSRS